ncbi:hypothetical protein BH09VER1_BH09VER1_13510 [soil metagenome]
MKQLNDKTLRKAALRFFITRNKVAARAYPVRWTYKVRAPDKAH